MFYNSILSKILGNNFGKSRRENLSKTLLKAPMKPPKQPTSVTAAGHLISMLPQQHECIFLLGPKARSSSSCALTLVFCGREVPNRNF